MKTLAPFLVISNTHEGPVPLCIIADRNLSDARNQATEEVADAFDVQSDSISVLSLPRSVLTIPIQDDTNTHPQSLESIMNSITNAPQRIHDFTSNDNDVVFLRNLFGGL